MSRLQDLADIAPDSAGGLEDTGGIAVVLALVVAVVVAVAVAVLIWRARNQQSRPPEIRPEPGFVATPASTPTPSPAPAPAPTSSLPSPALSEGPPFDHAKALELCGEDEELLRSVIEEIPEEIDSQMKVLREALAGNNASALHLSAHRLKGSLLLIAADTSAEVALSIELAGREEKLTNVAADVDRLDGELVRLKAAIAEYLRSTAES